MTAARGRYERTLSLLADVARGKVRCGWDANDKPVTYIAGEDATRAQLETIRSLHLAGRITVGAAGQYEITADGMTHLNTHYPTWRS